jgi:hypothetical protein
VFDVLLLIAMFRYTLRDSMNLCGPSGEAMTAPLAQSMRLPLRSRPSVRIPNPL